MVKGKIIRNNLKEQTLTCQKNIIICNYHKRNDIYKVKISLSAHRHVN